MSRSYKIALLIALYVAVELGRLAVSFGDIWGGVTFRLGAGGLLRRNILASILRRRGDQALPVFVPPASARSGRPPPRPPTSCAMTPTRW